jgi:hypothetical protein
MYRLKRTEIALFPSPTTSDYSTENGNFATIRNSRFRGVAMRTFPEQSRASRFVAPVRERCDPNRIDNAQNEMQCIYLNNDTSLQ